MTFSELEQLKRQARDRGDHTRAQLSERRERIATAAMQGILSSESSRLPYLYEDIASDAVNMADALIAVLDRDK